MKRLFGSFIFLSFGLILCCYCTVVHAEKIDINRASAGEMDKLPGIGPHTAETIVEYRKSHGFFKTIEEIKNVPRIGPETFEKIKDHITVIKNEPFKNANPPKPGSAAKAGNKQPSKPSEDSPAIAAHEEKQLNAGQQMPPEMIKRTCWKCQKAFYLSASCHEGWCPYCGTQWKSSAGAETPDQKSE